MMISSYISLLKLYYKKLKKKTNIKFWYKKNLIPFLCLNNFMKFIKLSKKRTTYLTALIVFVGILLWAFLSAAIITHNFHRSQLSGDADKQELNTSDIILTETHAGRKYWEIYGVTGSYSSNNKVATLNKVTGNFYSKDNNVSMSFVSSKGTYDSEKKQIILYKNTHIVIKDGTSLNCEYILRIYR